MLGGIACDSRKTSVTAMKGLFTAQKQFYFSVFYMLMSAEWESLRNMFFF